MLNGDFPYLFRRKVVPARPNADCGQRIDVLQYRPLENLGAKLYADPLEKCVYVGRKKTLSNLVGGLAADPHPSLVGRCRRCAAYGEG